MSTFLVRHAKAGSRRHWPGDDRERPLSIAGRKQAEAIADRLAQEGVTGLWSSPYRRCIETLEPLAERVGLGVKLDDRLAEGTPFEDTLALLREAGDGAVLCSHGDVIQAVIEALVWRGTVLLNEPDWRKGSIWVLEGDGEVFTTARAEGPRRA